MPIGGIGFGFAAGLPSILSPYVLPVLPLVFAPAAAHRFGLLALAAGLVTSFVGIGLFLATVGFSIGLGSEVFRDGAAVLLALLGIVLLSNSLQHRFATVAGGVGDAGNRLVMRLAPAGLSGQFVLGMLLGAVWSPCMGPTFGAASVLAAQGCDLASVAAVMVAFGVGAALPLLLLGRLSRAMLLRWRGRMMQAATGGKLLLGGTSLAVSVLILSGLDRTFETTLVNASPDWLTALTTRF